jgi:hypothetical protein
MVDIKPTESDAAKVKKARAQVSKALSNARQRCTNEKNKDYAAYGAMGIQVLIGTDDLIAAIGLPPKKASLDRIDPHGHYELGNIRWASQSVQAANKKSSLKGSMLPLHSLITQCKLMVMLDKKRPQKTVAWRLVLKALNYGTLLAEENAIISANLGLVELPNKTFRTREKEVGGVAQLVYSLPSLTFEDGLVEARGRTKKAPDHEFARRYLRDGLLYSLQEIEGWRNVPTVVRSAIDALLKGHCPGLTLVGRPTKDDLDSGWFEVWMLAAASRLPQSRSFDLTTALFPALTCLELLTEFGSSYKWDEVNHPLLDADLLFIPDFQLDCGPWGDLSNYQFGTLERLLIYRSDRGHKTIVGIQAPWKLSTALKKLLLGSFTVRPIANGTSSQVGIAPLASSSGAVNVVKV